MKIFELSISLLVLVFLSFTFPAFGCVQSDGECMVSGVIKGQDDKPIKGLTVAPCDDPYASTVTNKKGAFALEFTMNDSEENVLCIRGNKGVGRVVLTENMGAGIRQKSVRTGSITYPVVTVINLLHFNDAHGAIDNFPKIVAEIKRLKSENANTFVFDAGDNFSGNPVVDQANDKGKPFFDILNTIPIDAMAIGNHDFDYGQDVLKKRIDESSFPLLSANISVVNNNAIIEQPAPYKVLKTNNGLRIAVLSAIETSNNGRPSTLAKNVDGLDFSKGIDALSSYSFLKTDTDKDKKVDMVLALTHIGSNDDFKFAQENSFVDVVIGGHSHTLIIKNAYRNNAIIAQAGANLSHLGKVVVTFTNGKITSKLNQIVDVKNLSVEDATVRAMVNRFNDNPILAQTIGIADEAISGNNELGSLIADSIAAGVGADIAFQNNGGIRINNLAKGKITLKNAYELLPFGNQIVLMNMTTDEIKSLIKYSFEKRKSIDLQVSGIKYVVSGGGSQIDLLDYNDRPIATGKTYKVAMNDYIATGYKFDHQDAGQATYLADNDLLIKFIKNKGNVNYSGVKRASTR
ncbi:MAG: 5'-nucleotidase C-terminal domain-containing protein [Oligoflexia bacterium]|nr:5'-nucleotidase C-terminal domain-containing protein [Oligoflexia bacterium]